MTKKEHILTVHDRMKIAVEAMCHPKSVQRFYQRLLMKPMTELRVRTAAAKLGFPMPEQFEQKKATPVKGVARAIRRK